MQNSMVESHDAIDRLLFVMCISAHCTLTCIDNHINTNANNLHGLDEWCRIIQLRVMMQQIGFCLWCAQLHIVHSHALITTSVRMSIICVGLMSDAEQCGQEHDAMDKLLSMMYAVAHYSLTLHWLSYLTLPSNHLIKFSYQTFLP